MNNDSLQKLTLSLLLLSVNIAVHSQNPYMLSAGAREAGLSYAVTASPGFWSSFHNQANLAYMNKFSIGINQDNRFGLSELSNKTFGLLIPSGHGAIGAVYSYYGYSEYNRHTVGLAYGLKLGKMLSAGIQADLFSTRGAGDYQNINELTFEAGLLFRPLKGLSIGLHTFNPLPPALRNIDIPTVISLGTCYSFSDRLDTMLDLETSDQGNSNIRFGMEYQAYGNFFLRGGLMTMPWGYSFGTGYSGKILQCNLGFISHENLGLTPSLSLVLNIK